MIVYIPARSGSKRIKNKNTKIIDGKPLITHVIDIAKQLTFVNDIFVSTDSTKIESICKKQNVKTLELRKKKLSDDNSTFMDLIKFDIPRFSKYSKDFEILFILPTAILINKRILFSAYKQYKKEKPNLLISCEEPTHPIWWSLEVKKSGYLKPLFKNMVVKNSQFLKKTLTDSGLFYIFNQKKVKKYNSHKNLPKLLPFEIEYKYRCDLNTYDDLELLKYKYNILKYNV